MTRTLITDKDVVHGKKALKRALIDSRSYAVDPQAALKSLTAATDILDPFIKVKNLMSLVLHKVEGGWAADFILKKVPAGFPDVIGTPTHSPLPSKREAYQSACYIISDIRHITQPHASHLVN